MSGISLAKKHFSLMNDMKYFEGIGDHKGLTYFMTARTIYNIMGFYGYYTDKKSGKDWPKTLNELFELLQTLIINIKFDGPRKFTDSYECSNSKKGIYYIIVTEDGEFSYE